MFDTMNSGGQGSGLTTDGAANAMGFENVSDLLKAMSVGNVFPATEGDLAPGALMATIPQDLDDVLANQAFDSTRILLHGMLAQSKAFSTVKQFVRHQSPGSAGRDFLFHAEGGLPPESDSTFSLESIQMKYMGVVRRLPIQARLVRSIAGDTVLQQNKDGALEVLSGLEHALFHGDSRTNPSQFDGILRQMEKEGNVFDAAGGVPTEAMLDEAMERVTERPNWGAPTHMFASPRVHQTLRQVYAGRMRSMLGDRFHPNYQLKEMTFDHNSGGDSVKIVKHPLVIEESQVPVEAGRGPDPSKRPQAPIIVTQPAAANDADSLFQGAAGQASGTFFYRIVAVNASGWSTPVTTNAIAVADGQKATIVIKDSAVPNSNQSATGFKIYRTKPDFAATTATSIFQVAAAGAGNTTIVDINKDLPETSSLFIITNKRSAIDWVQLLPFFNFPLGNLDTSYRWALLLFGALKMGQPRHHAVIKNVAPDVNVTRQLSLQTQAGPQFGI